jgi:predicted acylesterase/phospholipase RssA
MTRRAFLLGAGGHAAIAWAIGLITGLAHAGIDVRDAELFVGTSAGSLVAAQLTSGVACEHVFQRHRTVRRSSSDESDRWPPSRQQHPNSTGGE